MADKEVKIYWDGTTPTYSGQPFKIDSKNRLRWCSADVDFAVFFCVGDSPFEAKTTVLACEKSGCTKYLTIRHLTKGEKVPVAEKNFKYCVALLDPATDTLVTDDPDIIVQDYGGGGGPGAKTAAKKQPKKAAAKPAKKKR